MKYVIMCGGEYVNFSTTLRPLLIVNGERLVERTIRLLQENGVDDICITTSKKTNAYDACNVPIIFDKNNFYKVDNEKHTCEGYWVNAFYKFNEPTCYLFGDVYYSENCIRLIVKARTKNINFFASSQPFAFNYIKSQIKPLCFKVQNYKTFYRAINRCKELYDEDSCWRHPKAFELWSVIKGLSISRDCFEKQTDDVFGEEFIGVHDYSCEIDNFEDIHKMEIAASKNEPEICVGIVSWFPDSEPNRGLRVERLDRAFSQLNALFGDIHYIVIAQNWRDYTPPEYIKDIQIVECPCLGILGARKKLGEEFLKSRYDYLVMCDDDILIINPTRDKGDEYIRLMRKNFNGFCFLQYRGAQLNLCAISKFIYSREPMVNIDPQRDEGFEDVIYSHLLHYKYTQYEFAYSGVECNQFLNPNEKAPSTWALSLHDYPMMHAVSNYFINRFKQGDFSIDKNKAMSYVRDIKRFERETWKGWINGKNDLPLN